MLHWPLTLTLSKTFAYQTQISHHSITTLAKTRRSPLSRILSSPRLNLRKKWRKTSPVSSSVFPGLNTLGMSFVRADFGPGAINVPHFHPRATEVAFVLEGKLYSGFVDSNNRVFAKIIEKGEVMVFPRGLLHFQMNVGEKTATILGSFDSQNPGLVKIPNAVFGAGIEEELLKKAFELSLEEILRLRKRFSPQS